MIPAHYNSGNFIVLAIASVLDDSVLSEVIAGSWEHDDASFMKSEGKKHKQSDNQTINQSGWKQGYTSARLATPGVLMFSALQIIFIFTTLSGTTKVMKMKVRLHLQ